MSNLLNTTVIPEGYNGGTFSNIAHENTDQLVDEHAASTILNRKVPTLRKDRWAGTGVPFIKIGRSVRYSVKDLRDYISANRVHSTTEAAV